MIDDGALAHVRDVKCAHESELLRLPNVVGVGIGLGQGRGCQAGVPTIVVSVTRKVPATQLDPADVIPTELEGVPVDVQVIGELRAL